MSSNDRDSLGMYLNDGILRPKTSHVLLLGLIAAAKDETRLAVAWFFRTARLFPDSPAAKCRC